MRSKQRSVHQFELHIAPDSFAIYERHVVQETKQLYKSILSTFHKKKNPRTIYNRIIVPPHKMGLKQNLLS